jgi:hypothetical protein
MRSASISRQGAGRLAGRRGGEHGKAGARDQLREGAATGRVSTSTPSSIIVSCPRQLFMKHDVLRDRIDLVAPEGTVSPSRCPCWTQPRSGEYGHRRR